MWPALANAPARGVPDWPEPIMIASYLVVEAIVLRLMDSLMEKNGFKVGRWREHLRGERNKKLTLELRTNLGWKVVPTSMWDQQG